MSAKFSLSILGIVISGCDSEDATRQVEEPEYQDASPLPTDSTTQLYSTPDEVRKSDKKELNQSFDNPGYYSTLQDVHSTADTNKGPTNTLIVR